MKLNKYIYLILILLCICTYPGRSQSFIDAGTFATVDFSTKLADWDGFGVNYVQAARTHDYKVFPQDYGGFGFLTEEQRQEIIQLVFGDNGLKPSVVKMFLDPLHQTKPGAKFDHEATTQWMRYFVQEGLKLTRARGEDLTIITTLYGPPAWATLQRQLNGRDLDPAQFNNLAIYIADWVKFLREKEKLPVKYVSFFNEADKPHQWPKDGTMKVEDIFDYNTYWTPTQTADFIPILRSVLDKQDLKDVLVSPGECTSWSHFSERMYGWNIALNPQAIDALGLLTSHSFGPDTWLTPAGANLIRSYKPEIRTWVTSSSWGSADMHMPHQVALNINKVKVNSIIPWAVVQTPSQWHMGVDPNAAPPIRISENGTYEVTSTYSFYKHFTLSGRKGMVTVPTMVSGSADVELVGFGSNGTDNPNTFTLINNNSWGEGVIAIKVFGTEAKNFKAIRSYRKYGSKALEEYKEVGNYCVDENGYIIYHYPPHSVTTFIEVFD
jgi:O-glycosyl hydrolase